ncbi:MAG: ECF transporter S component [Candidatus Thorarchaeota archaeon]
MALQIDANSSRTVAFVAVFSALTAVLDIIPAFGFTSGVWDSWAFQLSPIVGILLGPYLGAISVGLGSFLGHVIISRDPIEFLFMIGLSFGAAIAGFVYQRRWKPVFGIYSAMLFGYFVYPISWGLPLWGIWDILVAYMIVLTYTLMTARNSWSNTSEKSKMLMLVFCCVIALETDILFRVFILVPGQMWWFYYAMTPEDLALLWIGAGFVTPIKVVMGIVVIVTLGRQLLRTLEQQGNSIALADSDSLPE